MGTTKEVSWLRLKPTHAHCYIYTTDNKDTVDPPEAPDDIDSNPESEEDQRGQCVVCPKQATAQKVGGKETTVDQGTNWRGVNEFEQAPFLFCMWHSVDHVWSTGGGCWNLHIIYCTVSYPIIGMYLLSAPDAPIIGTSVNA